MIEIVDTSINTLPFLAVSPTDNPILSRLLVELQSLRSEVQELREDNQDLIKKAIQPLQDEILDLKAMIDRQDEKIGAMEAIELQDINRVCVDIAQDRQRISKLEHSPGETDEGRAEKLKGYLTAKRKANMKPEASFTEARTYLEVSRSQFSQLISKLDPREFVIYPHPLNYKAKMIGLAHKV
jgi:HPt (histidine-containing phosphotransfer) domain-containing protein